MTSTRSPSRMSFWAISSSLCSVALLTVTPAICTGSSDGPGIERAGAAHVDLDLLEPGDRDLGRELPGDGPARLAPAHDAELAVKRKPVHLDHHAVGLERQARYQLLEARDRAPGPRPASRSARGAAPPGSPSPASWSRTSEWVRGLETALDRLDGEGEHPEPPLSRDRRVELAETARGGVARVGEQRLALLARAPR